MTYRQLSSVALSASRVVLLAAAACMAGFVPVSLAQAQPADGIVHVEFRPVDDASKGYPFIFSFHGKQFVEPLWFVSKADAIPPLAPGEEFLRKVLETNASGEADELLALWNPEERPVVFQDLSDEDAFTRNRSFFRNVERAGILAELLYGDYTIFVVLHSGSVIEDHVQLYPVLRSAGEFFMTNRLQDDPVLQFVFLVYEDRLQQDLTQKREGS